MTPEQLAELMADEVKAYVGEARTSLIALIDERIKAIPAPAQGPKGETGEKGEAGKDGAPGRDGEAGKPGDRGLDGAPGINGKDGRDGKDGEPGKDGAPGAPGERGAFGERGIDGRDGRDGKDGIASRDEITALVQTEVEKRLEIEVVKRVEAAIAALPIVTYKGVYKEGTEYRPGNTVSFGGDLWHCNVPTSAKPLPGGDWTLAVKKGRDGREPERKALYNGGRPA